MDDRYDLPPEDGDSERDTPVFGPPHPGRARIAGVEAGVAAGLVSPGDDERNPRNGGGGGAEGARVRDETGAMSVPLPAWTDPPTREVPRVLRDPSEAPGPSVPGPVWREDESDWDRDSLALADLMSEGSTVAEHGFDPRPEDDDHFGLPPAPTRTISSNPVGPNAALPQPGGRHRRGGVVWAGRRGREGAESTPVAPEEVVEERAAPELPQGRPQRGPAGPVPAGDRQFASDETQVVEAVRSAPAADETQVLDATTPLEGRGSSRRMSPRARLRFAGRGRSKVLAGDAADASAAARAAGEPFDAAAGAATAKTTGRRSPVVATITGLAVGALALLCFLAGPPAVLAFVSLLLVVAMAETYQAFRSAHYRPAAILGLLATPAGVIAGYFRGTQGVLLTLAAFLFVTFVWHLTRLAKHRRIANLTVTTFGWLWVGGLGAFAGLLISPSAFPDRHGIAYLLGALEAVVAYDIGGYLFGNLLGQHKLAPSISPNKTWEGVFGGSLCALVVALAITRLMAPWTLAHVVALGVVVAVVAPFGDLAESMVKRELHLKDMGSLLPAHGGVMDRIDAILFVVPATYYLVLAFHG